jgi:hypothetical protein
MSASLEHLKPEGQELSKPLLLRVLRMDELRRQLFLAYFNGQLKGDRALLIQRSGYSKGRISQFFNEEQAFGERAARELAVRLRLPEDAFLGLSDPTDMPAPLLEQPLSAEALALATLFDNFPPDQRRHYLAVISAEIVKRLPGGSASNTHAPNAVPIPRPQTASEEPPEGSAPVSPPKTPGTARQSK